MIRRRIGLLVAAPLLAFSLDHSGADNGRSPTFEIDGTTATVRWEVTPREEGPMCYFNAHLVGLDEGDAVASVDLVVAQNFVPRRAARMMRLPERPSGEARIEVEPGTYYVSVYSIYQRNADGSTEGCESYRVRVDG